MTITRREFLAGAGRTTAIAGLATPALVEAHEVPDEDTMHLYLAWLAEERMLGYWLTGIHDPLNIRAREWQIDAHKKDPSGPSRRALPILRMAGLTGRASS